MNNWRYKLFRFMQGRYGMDDLGKFLLIASMVVILLSNFRHLHILYPAGLLMLIYTYFRFMSRNIFRRQRENQKYVDIRRRFSKGQSGKNQYLFYRCRNCGQTVRVPKGKGTLKITCPNCGNSFIERT